MAPEASMLRGEALEYMQGAFHHSRIVSFRIAYA